MKKLSEMTLEEKTVFMNNILDKYDITFDEMVDTLYEINGSADKAEDKATKVRLEADIRRKSFVGKCFLDEEESFYYKVIYTGVDDDKSVKCLCFRKDPTIHYGDDIYDEFGGCTIPYTSRTNCVTMDMDDLAQFKIIDETEFFGALMTWATELYNWTFEEERRS